MSTNTSTTNVTIAVDDHGTDTTVLTQYGMRYPDGTVKWGNDGSSIGAIDFGQLRAGHDDPVSAWGRRLRERATVASLDVKTYADQHQLLKRTIVVAVTAPEEV